MNERILVVDDEPEIVRVLRGYLEQANYTVLTASSGPEALRRARTEAPDLILLDVMLPGMDGIDVAYVLRNHESTKGSPIIFVTAIFSRRQVGASEYQIGENCFLFKPITFNQVLREIGAKLG